MPLTSIRRSPPRWAPMAEAGFAPPAVGDIAGRRAIWEPIIGAASTALPIPADVTTTEHEDTAYATKLSRAGVPVEFHLHPGAPHEFDAIAFDADVARRAIADRVRVLKSI
jgi:acetyl esterase/lipase